MTEPSGYDLKWSSNLSAFPTPSGDKDEYPRPFQLFGPWSSYTSPNLNTPASPVPEHASSPLNAHSASLVPHSVPVVSPEFNPFAQEEGEDDDALALTERFLTTHFLDDIEKEEVQTSTTHSATVRDTAPPSWDTWQPAVSPLASGQTLKSIWTTNNTNWERPGLRDETEFDPTLQYYHGSLLDAETIRDMNDMSLSVTNPSVEETQAENVGEDMSALQMLETVFTDVSEADLKKALEQYDYDLDAAMEYLLDRKNKNTSEAQGKASAATVSATTEAVSTSETHTPRKRQVCRHFLAGECYRKDCWFAHDLQVKVCKFWLQGSCLKGDYCEFSHYIDVQEVASKIAPAQATKEQPQQPNRFDESEYPGLQSSNSRQSVATSSVRPAATTTPALSATEEFPTLASAAQMRSTSGKTTAPINFAEAAKRKTQPQKNKVKMSRANKQRQLQRLKEPVRIPWLETGSALNRDYLTQREKAIEYGMMRNRFFNRATQYYLNGDGAKARAYSNEAKYYNRLMQEMHAEASRKIFEQRNKNEAFIDLHGLHVDEALDIVEERLNKLKDYSGVVYIVTGTGHHSGDNGRSKKQSKLKPSVEEFLNQGHYRYAETSVLGDNMGGIFAVDLSLR